MNLRKKFENAPGWFINSEPYVISGRVRLARSVEGYKFPWKLNPQESMELIDEVLSVKIDNATYLKSHDMDITLKKLLIERHLVSPDFTKYQNTACIVTESEDMSIMVNEEDHIRIQTFAAGVNIESALKTAKDIHNTYSKILKFLTHERWGYITTCPTNLGAGLRVSFLMHLPGIFETSGPKFFEDLGKVGIAVRGFYGEGSKPLAHLIQISNASSFGRNEYDIIQNMKKVVEKIIHAEEEARKKLTSNINFIEECFRAYGILKETRNLNLEESFKYLSLVRFIVAREIIKINMEVINNLLIIVQNAHIDNIANTELGILERRKMRANVVREKLK